MEAGMDFKSLRAKFQADLERPALPDRPKRFPPLLPTVHAASSENRNPPTGAVSYKEECKSSLGKRPISFPSYYTQAAPSEVAVTSARRSSVKDSQPPISLPISSSNEESPDHAASSKLVTSPVRCKKKAMPTPFKPNKFSKCIKDILENAGEHSESSRAHRLQLGRDAGTGVENGFGHHSGHTNGGSLSSSPEPPVTPSPPGAETSGTGVMSTLERAKKKFSPKNLLVYARPKSFYSNRGASGNSPPAGQYENLHRGSPPSAQTSPNATGSRDPRSGPTAGGAAALGSVDVKRVLSGRIAPPIRTLPLCVGPAPPKPPRPPRVHLSCHAGAACGCALAQTPVPDVPETCAAADAPSLPPLPRFDAPDFPDFRQSVLDALNSNMVGLAVEELEDVEFGTPPLDLLPIAPGPEQENQLQDHLENLQINTVDDDNAAAAAVETQPFSQITSLDSGTAASVTSDPSLYGAHGAPADSSSSEPPSEPSLSQWAAPYEVPDNVYEEVETVTKFHVGQNSRKWKNAPKNPYAVSPVKEELSRNTQPAAAQRCAAAAAAAELTATNPTPWDRKERCSPEQHDEKELRKREKQRLEREKKEQKEREKRENEMKKKFKVTGQEEPMYFARVLVSSKGRKHHLHVQSGDTVSIIRTTNCPKGKWLARDTQHTYGYISVMNVELNMREMLELGRRASQTAGRGQHAEVDTLSLSSRSSQHNPALTSSFTDDSEEWTGDDEASSPSAGRTPVPHLLCPNKSSSMPDMLSVMSSRQQQQRCVMETASVEDVHSEVTHEALQKLAVFFQNKADLRAAAGVASVDSATCSVADAVLPAGPDGGFLCAMVDPPQVEDEEAFSFADVELLPPPDLYAD